MPMTNNPVTIPTVFWTDVPTGGIPLMPDVVEAIRDLAGETSKGLASKASRSLSNLLIGRKRGFLFVYEGHVHYAYRAGTAPSVFTLCSKIVAEAWLDTTRTKRLRAKILTFNSNKELEDYVLQLQL